MGLDSKYLCGIEQKMEDGKNASLVGILGSSRGKDLAVLPGAMDEQCDFPAAHAFQCKHLMQAWNGIVHMEPLHN